MPWPPGQEFEARQAESPVPQILPTVQEEEPSAPPHRMLDPWSQRSEDIEQGLELIAQRREHATYSDSAIGSEANSEHAYSPNITGQMKPPQQPAVPPKSPSRIITPASLSPSVEQTISIVRAHHGRESISPISQRLNRDSVASSADTSLHSSVSDYRSRERDSYFDTASPVSPTSPHVRPLFAQTSSSTPTAHVNESLEPVMLPAPGIIPDGLMLAEEDTTQPVWPFLAAEMQLGGCAISLHSSYYQFGGFCKGAMEIIQGGLGIKHIKKQVSTRCCLMGVRIDDTLTFVSGSRCGNYRGCKVQGLRL